MKKDGHMENDVASVGGEQIKVSLYYVPQLPPGLPDKERELRHKFWSATWLLTAKGLQTDRDSLSVAGQFIEATVPANQLQHVTDELLKHQIRVDEITQTKTI